MAKSSVRSTKDLGEALHHVAYEYVALRSALHLCSTPPSKAVFAAAFDSFLLHYRNLVEFFQHEKDRRRQRPTDLRAQDYVRAWVTPSLPMWTHWGAKIHILLAHLSTRRNAIHRQAAGLNHERDFPGMSAEIENAWGAFADGVKGTAYGSTLSEKLHLQAGSFDGRGANQS